ncbi:MAG: AAA family ATPase [Infirmifilum sp.]
MDIKDSMLPVRRIVLDHRKMSSEYVPVYLPHREAELRETLRYFQAIIKGEKGLSKVIIFDGPTGTGKTAVAKRILLALKEYLSAGKIPPLTTSYVNAYELRTKFVIFRKIGEDVGLRFPRKGFSTHEVMDYTLHSLQRTDSNLVVVLDEADVLVKQEEGEDTIYTLTRLREIYTDIDISIGIIAIFRDFKVSIEHISNAGIRSSLSSTVIRFNPYNSRQLKEILEHRIEKEGAIRSEAVSEDVIEMIANIFGYEDGKGWGDARMAIKTLYYAALRAESQERSMILPEDVREVLNQGILPTPYDEEEIMRLQLHEKLILLAITNVLMLERDKAYVSMGDVEFEYEDLCNEYGVKPLRHTSIWEKIQLLESKGLIDTRVSSKSGKGRTTQIAMPQLPENKDIGINRVPLEVLQKILQEAIKKDLDNMKVD